ncbi:hypothetical protein CYMTET_27248 [Cymbomonas tetramitiformis]|uniref:Uncharacterized protein n=1 Tax=Cymbomonas tetramitiformis TaxID=36881 RepID=A0AAE0FQS3_9CHLO|nr:hypothetical protein CYMTET_27248 [Cymbomonas tetramitiformis]
MRSSEGSHQVRATEYRRGEGDADDYIINGSDVNTPLESIGKFYKPRRYSYSRSSLDTGGQHSPVIPCIESWDCSAGLDPNAVGGPEGRVGLLSYENPATVGKDVRRTTQRRVSTGNLSVTGGAHASPSGARRGARISTGNLDISLEQTGKMCRSDKPRRISEGSPSPSVAQRSRLSHVAETSASIERPFRLPRISTESLRSSQGFGLAMTAEHEGESNKPGAPQGRNPTRNPRISESGSTAGKLHVRVCPSQEKSPTAQENPTSWH